MRLPTRRTIRTLAVATATIALVGTTIIGSPPTSSAAEQPWMNAGQSPEKRAHELVSAMRLSEKVQMLHGADRAAAPLGTTGYIPAIKRLHVPAMTMTDGPAGVRNGTKATEMPAPIAQAASFDTATARQYGKVLGRDAKARGQRQIYGPGMNIDRIALNGRNFEYFSEDPLLSGSIAGADVQGVQDQGVMATLKHYLANSQETDRSTVSANVDDRTLHELYEKNFGIAVEQSRPASVMCSYNRINDVHACGNRKTLDDLRDVLGFDGFVVTDYPASHSTTDIKNGLNVEMPKAQTTTLAAVKAALQRHDISISDIDARVQETLTVMFRFGLFEHPELTVGEIDEKADNKIARSVVENSAVLLKNADGALPLGSGTASGKKVAVIGATAKESAQGGGSSKVDPLSVDNAYDAIVDRAGPHASVSYNDGADPKAAAEQAEAADTAVVVAGDTSAEGADRTTLALPDNQDTLIKAVAAVNPHTVVVLETGAPVLTPWIDDVAGVLEAWYPGARGGAAIAGLLWGDVNPSGKLPQTWPASDTQVPTSTPEQFPGKDLEGSYSEGLNVGYRWYDATKKTPQFAFGHGLSYTSFSYANLKLDKASGNSRRPIRATVDVTNTGERAGSEAVQAYVGKPDTLVDSPPRQLAAFSKVHLKAGQTKRVQLKILPRELGYWDTGASAFNVQTGKYTVSVGGSSRALPVKKQYRVTKSDGPVRFTAGKAERRASAGSVVDIDATISNLSSFRDSKISTVAQAPQGWKISRRGTPADKLRPGAKTGLGYSVRVPKNAAGGRYEVTLRAKGTVHGEAVSTTRTITVTVPHPSFTAAYDTIGLTADADPAPGNWDTDGYSYSAVGLAEKGIAPGQPVDVDGHRVTFPDPAPGEPDAVTAHGQEITMGEKTSELVLVGAATNADIRTQLRIRYADGTSEQVPVAFNNWYYDKPAEGTSLLATTYWNSANGEEPHDVSVFGTVIKTDESRRIASIQLPQYADLHLFTLAPGT